MKPTILTLLFLIFFSCSPKPALGSQPSMSDTTVITSIMEDALDLLNISQHEQSLAKYYEAKYLAKQAGSWRQFIQCDVKIILNLWRLDHLDSALSMSRSVLPIAMEKLGARDFEVGEILFQIGTIHMLAGASDSTIYYYNKAIDVKSDFGERSWSTISGVHANMGYIYGNKGDLEKQLESFQKAYEVDMKIYEGDHLFIAEDLTNISATLILRSSYKQAEVYLLEALEMLKRLNNDGELHSYILNNLGGLYARTEEFDKAKEYGLQSLRKSIRLFGESHLNNASIYQQLGRTFRRSGAHDSSIYFFEKGLEFEAALRTSKNQQLIFLMSGVAISHAERGDSLKAVNYAEKAVSLGLKMEVTNTYLGSLYNEIGVIYSVLKNPMRAREYFLKALKHYDKGEIDNPLKVFTIQNLAELDYDKGDMYEALQYTQMALEANHENWKIVGTENPTLDGVLNNEHLLLALKLKGDILFELLKIENGEGKILDLLLELYSLIDEVISEERNEIERVGDKLTFSKFSNYIFQRAIEANLLKYEMSSESQYLKKCFEYSEKNKSTLLLQALRNESAKTWSKVPNELLLLEEESKASLSYYATALRNEHIDIARDSTKMMLYEEKIFDLNYTVDSLKSKLEEDYPDYYQLKYANDPISVEGIQEALDRSTLFLEYFIGERSSYVFYISKNEFGTKRLSAGSQIKQQVDELRQSLNLYEVGSQFNQVDFVHASNQLYQSLVDPVASSFDGIEKLLIVPSGAINYVPFGLLLEDLENQGDFRSLSYLLNSYSVQNVFSASISLLNSKRSLGSGDFIGFAPSYPVDNDEFLLEKTVSKFRNAITPLMWNSEEIEKIEKIVGGTNFSNQDATEHMFKKQANDYRVVHLAMHAFVDDEDPMHSHLVFTNDNDTIEDGLLHLFELYNMQMNADLVVLSACETGYGKLFEGEGVMSLAQGFAYSGVPSVVMSHWSVDDQSTSQLMSYFYEFLNEGLTKSKALKKAKMKFLETADAQHTHPFYWGAFTSIGDDDPVFQSSRYWLFNLGGLVVVGLVVFRRRMVTKAA